MKYLVLFALSLVSLSGIIPVYAQYDEQVPDLNLAPNSRQIPMNKLNKAILEPFDQSDVVLIEKIVEIKILQKENKSEYGISVEQYLKNQKPHDLIVATGDGIAQKTITDFNEINYYNDPIFKKDDRVFVYLVSKDNKYVISPYSFALSKNLPTGPPPDNVWVTANKSEFYGRETIVISGEIKKAILYTSVVDYGANQTGIIEIYDPNRIKYLSDTLDVNPDGSFSYEFRIKGNSGISGRYEYDILDGFGLIGSTFEHVPSPLQQYRAESRDDVKCQIGFELLRKASTGFTACITHETKTKLVKRGWGSETWPFSSIVENKTSCNIIQEITPGPYPIQSCPVTANQITTTTLNSSGFASVHHTSILTFADNYVLEPGHNGTVTYSLGLSDAMFPDLIGDIPSRNTNLTNYAQFIHYKTLELKELENYPDTILKKDSTSFATCFETPYDSSCMGELTTSSTVNAFVYDHPGVSVHFDKQYEFLTKGQNVTLTVTFSASKDAVPGTYVVILPQGTCSGGLILLTIGDCPYKVNDK